MEVVDSTEVVVVEVASEVGGALEEEEVAEEVLTDSRTMGLQNMLSVRNQHMNIDYFNWHVFNSSVTFCL